MTATVVLASATLGSSIVGIGVASATDTTVEQTFTLSGLNSIKVYVYCPQEAKYFLNHDYTPGRAVQKGVEVIESGGIGVSIANNSGTATNWNVSTSELKIITHCTSDVTKAAQGQY
ncbi:hypothetical protein [Mycolicibacterium insubricum]|uniref:Uncharacterized protein n=2 Tax=Mycolicibacterium insubricum TaxID=444597 RepID=A0A1X0DL17_9MYCO|nr:hypothetical protein [Mycolicibacterium insubricum]MCV7081745.1 hypothetical protein [Mycolicibacterium insubricum]ORA72852.1 hypothetical protein BST26_04450 [Mycolicibacterium insubricum]